MTTASAFSSVPDCGPPKVFLHAVEYCPPPQPLPGKRHVNGLTETIELGERVVRMAERLSGASGFASRAPSFRKLAKLGVLPMGASSMWRAATIYRLAQQYPELREYQHLGVAHVAALLRVKGPLQIALLRLAETHRWSRRRLEAKLKRLRIEAGRGEADLVTYMCELGLEPSDSAIQSLVDAGLVPEQPSEPTH